MIQAGAARIVILPIAAIAVLLTTRMAIGTVGARQYGVVSLLVTLPALIPISDLGLGGTITSHMGRHGWVPGATPRLVRRVTVLLTVISSAMIVVAAVLAATGLTAQWLGVSEPHSNLVSFVVVALFAITLPLGVGTRILIGLERQARSTVLQTMIPVYALALLGITLLLGARDFSSVVIALASAPLLSGVMQCLAAHRLTRGVSSRPPTADPAVAPLIDGRHRIAREAIPLTIMSVTIPIAYQSDRVVLAHLSGATQLSQYAVAATLFGSLVGVIGAAGTSLWPYFQRVRATGGDLRQQFFRRGGVLVAAGAVMAVGLVSLGEPASELLTAEKIAPSFALIVWFSVLLFLTAVEFPLAMLMICLDELWYSAIWCVAMVAANLAISIILTPHLGAIGPVIGSVCATFGFLTMPFAVKAVRTLGWPTGASRTGESFAKTSSQLQNH